MGWIPNSHSGNIAVLVVNKNHVRFGQMGVQTYHDWREYGVRFVKFEDGEETFEDGLEKNSPIPPIRTYYHIRNEKGKDFDDKGQGPNSFKYDFIQFGFGTEKDFLDKYKTFFGVDF